MESMYAIESMCVMESILQITLGIPPVVQLLSVLWCLFWFVLSLFPVVARCQSPPSPPSGRQAPHWGCVRHKGRYDTLDTSEYPYFSGIDTDICIDIFLPILHTNIFISILTSWAPVKLPGSVNTQTSLLRNYENCSIICASNFSRIACTFLATFLQGKSSRIAQ